MENFTIATPEIKSNQKRMIWIFFGICTYQKNWLEKNKKKNTLFFGYFRKFRSSIWAPQNQSFAMFSMFFGTPCIEKRTINFHNCLWFL